jgi:hypothetical protein
VRCDSWFSACLSKVLFLRQRVNFSKLDPEEEGTTFLLSSGITRSAHSVTSQKTQISRLHSFLAQSSEGLWNPGILLSSVYMEAISPGLRRAGREAGNIAASAAEVTNMWSNTTSLAE